MAGNGGSMDSWIKWALGCALGLCISAGAQATLLDSVRVADEAFLLSDSHLYRYHSVSGNVQQTDLSSQGSPVAMALDDDAVFIAYSNGRLEKRDLTGALVPDSSGGDVTRNFQDITDIALHGEKLFVAFTEGNELHVLETSDLSASNASYSLSETMQKLVPYVSGSSDLTFYSPDGVDLNLLNWPPTLVDDEVEVAQFDIAQGHGNYLETPDDLFIIDNNDGAFVVMDNGSYWSINGPYLSWIAGQEFRFLDQAEDGKWSVVRGRVAACESGDDLNWTTDLTHYSTAVSFESRSKLGSEGVIYEVAHLWGSDPKTHLFREAGLGNLVVDTVMRSEGLPFDDGKQPYSVAANAPLSIYQQVLGVSSQHVALDDESNKAYVLHQGNNRCEAAIRVFDLQTKTWASTIPLRWRPQAIAMVGGDSPDASDDKLAVVYEQSFNAYGRSQMLVSYIDVNASSPQEDPAKDFDDYGVFFSNLSTVQASRHAVLFQMEFSNEGSVITAWGPNGELDFYQDCEGSGTCSSPRDIEFWQSRAAPGEQTVLVLKAGDDVRLLQLDDFAGNVTFLDPGAGWTMTLADNFTDVEAPLVFSPGNNEFVALNLNDGAAGFQRGTPNFNQGKPEDFLPVSLQVSTWSESTQGDEDNYVLYNLSGGDPDTDAPALIQRWSMVLGSDGHFEFDNEDQVEVAGRPIMVRVVDPQEDNLLVATLHQEQVRFTPFDRSLGVTPGDDGGGDSGGDGDTGGDTDVDNPGSGNGSGGGSNGFGSSGGGATIWIIALLGLLVSRRRSPGMNHC